MSAHDTDISAELEALRERLDPERQTDDHVRERLRQHEVAITYARQRYGHSTMRSDVSMIEEALDKAWPWIAEAKRRGITSSRLADILNKMSDRSLRTLYRCGKNRARHLFSDPKAMIVLRNVCLRRGLLDE